MNFRNLVTPSLSFEEGLTAVVGPNAAGKSNLLHAAYLGLTGELLGKRIAESVSLGQEQGYVGAVVENQLGKSRIEVGLAPGRKTLKIDGQSVRTHDISLVSSAVLIAPDDAELIHGSPSRRRAYIDGVLSKLSPRYALILREYNRVVEQRNSCLKSHQDGASLEIWTERLSDLGQEVNSLRERVVVRIEELSNQAYGDIAGALKQLTITLRRVGGNLPFSEALTNSGPEERARGITVVGPHRDDLDLKLSNHSIQTYGSRGEARTTALALRVAELKLLREKHHEEPVLLLDDFTAELDSSRREFLLELARATPQALVSGTESPLGARNAFRIDRGTIVVA
jgi:DNA replication and repair protein RecF